MVLNFKWLPVAAAAGLLLAALPAHAEEQPANAQDGVAQVPAGGGVWPSRVTATYSISFGALGEIGTFKFSANVSGQSYNLIGNAELSALLGAFTWQGATRSAGTVVGEAPKPAGYTFDFRTGQRGGAVKMSFAEGSVVNVATVPPSPSAPGTVPVRQEHLKDVLDPLTAVMALSRGRGSNPCGRKLSIFDGKQRFDLVLSFRRQQRIAETRPSGQPSIAYVCRVRYIPIAGHRNNDETRDMAASGGIEVALRPIPSANLLVPYQITVPTMAGTATLTSQRIDIVTPSRRQIALVN